MTKSTAAGAQLAPAGPQVVEAVGSEWNRLAVLAGSPFLTQEWISSWWDALGDGQLLCALLRDSDGLLRAGAYCRLSPNGELTAPTDSAYSYEWNVVAQDATARQDVWEAIARFGARRINVTLLPDRPDGAGAACAALELAGYRVVRKRVEVSPYLALPGSWDELLRSISKNLRHKLRRNRRGLVGDGALVLRTIRSETDLERGLELFFALEASGWKGRAGTAILCDPRAERLYRSFARAAARQGWLRLSILECAGTPVAASYGCAFAGRAVRLKSAYDERFAGHSPGLVLLGEELQRSIDEGLHEYDFLGSAEFHKLRWNAKTRDRVTVRGYRGASTFPAYAYRARVRPLLGRIRRGARRVAKLR